jgi:hypothetical protein
LQTASANASSCREIYSIPLSTSSFVNIRTAYRLECILYYFTLLFTSYPRNQKVSRFSPTAYIEDQASTFSSQTSLLAFSMLMPSCHVNLAACCFGACLLCAILILLYCLFSALLPAGCSIAACMFLPEGTGLYWPGFQSLLLLRWDRF